VIFYDTIVDSGSLVIGAKKNPFNYNTLEPKLLKKNGREKLNKILGTTYTTDDDLHKFMKLNKTECALKIFETKEDIKIPSYIINAIS
jgi:putative ATP-dependent endonuclease of OLD family